MGSRLKNLAKTLLGPRLVGWAGARWLWGRTLVNYLLMRSWLGRLLGVRAWPHSLYIEGTNICSAACVFCAYPQMERPKKVMPLELFASVVDQYLALGGDEVDLTPIVGDPFADGKVLERLDLLAARPQVRRFHFFTNAIGMRPDLSEKLLGYGERLKVFISLGGFDRQTYLKTFGVDKFEVVEANIRALLESKRRAKAALRVQVNLRTPADKNQGPLWEHLLQAKRDGLIELTWMAAFDSWAGRIQDSDLRGAGLEPRPMPVKRGACHRLVTSPVVLADGRVNACACRDVEASLIVGDVTRQPLAEILGGAPLRELLDRHARGDLPEVCRRCTYYDSVWPAWLVGGPDRPDPSGPVALE